MSSAISSSKESLLEPGTVVLFTIVSFDSIEIYVRVKERLESTFSTVLFESNPLPRWTFDPGDRLNVRSGYNTRVLSFKKYISRERLPIVRKKCVDVRNKYYSKDPTLRVVPGYLNYHNMILSSTSDDFHRLYLSNGVFSEVVYQYEKLQYKPIQTAPSFFENKDVLYYFSTLREFFIKSGIK